MLRALGRIKNRAQRRYDAPPSARLAADVIAHGFPHERERHQLVIELDGDSHYTDRAESYDSARTDALSSHGIRVVRFTNTDVLQNFEHVCAAILGVLGES